MKLVCSHPHIMQMLSGCYHWSGTTFGNSSTPECTSDKKYLVLDPRNLPGVVPTLVETCLNPWRIQHCSTSKDELELPSCKYNIIIVSCSMWGVGRIELAIPSIWLVPISQSTSWINMQNFIFHGRFTLRLDLWILFCSRMIGGEESPTSFGSRLGHDF